MAHTCDGMSPCCQNSSLFDQTFDELQFERGIWQAAYDGDINKTKQFVSKGVNLNIKDSAGYTALHYAARNGNFAVVKFLLEKGACVNCVTKSGKDTPLHRAAFVGHLDIVKLLIRHGANIYIQNTDGQTCLHRSVQSSDCYDVTEYLLSHKNLKDIKDTKGKTANDYAGSEKLKKLFFVND